MKMNNSKNRDIDFYLSTIAKFCDKCGTKYTVNNLQIIQENEQSSIIHFKCNKCKSKHIASFVSTLGISSRTSINSDIEPSELSRYSIDSQIMIDEVLDINESFKKSRIIAI